MNLRRLNDDVTLAIANGLHQIENLERIKNLRTAAEVTAAVEGGTQRYLHDPAFRVKVQTIVAGVMLAVSDAAAHDKPTEGK